ncbi:hypothetical protein Hesp01_11980 [Herbidospora sp. NBRC 101105]|nr:hypothetical protein Hesp01_11980 [Herbidospora sp. NBRC 101105]
MVVMVSPRVCHVPGTSRPGAGGLRARLTFKTRRTAQEFSDRMEMSLPGNLRQNVPVKAPGFVTPASGPNVCRTPVFVVMT